MKTVDMSAFFKIGYGLYVVTSHDGTHDNGMICNTVVQITGEPARLSVTINKANYTHDVVKASGKMNVCTLAESAPFSVFENFGFRSGRDADKFASCAFTRTENGLAVPARHCNSVFALTVENYIDLGTHGMFICSVDEAAVLSNEPTMTYAYYHANVKPKPKAASAAPDAPKRWVCPICGYVYEGEGRPPADYLCPLCKHPGTEFVEE